MQVENTRFQRTARGVLVLRHVPGCNDLRSLTIEKNADREDFRGANRVDNSRNRSVMKKQALNGRNRMKLQRTNKM